MPSTEINVENHARKPKDRRYRETEAKLFQSLLSLMESKPLNTIAVRELVQMSGLSRATFYQHYSNIFELHEAVEQQILDRFDSYVNAITRRIILLSAKTADLSRQNGKLLDEFMAYIYKNAGTIQTLLRQPNSSFLNHLYARSHSNYLPVAKRILSSEDLELAEYYFTFLVNGMIGMVRVWLDSNCSMPLANMIHMSNRYILMSLDSFRRIAQEYQFQFPGSWSRQASPRQGKTPS